MSMIVRVALVSVFALTDQGTIAAQNPVEDRLPDDLAVHATVTLGPLEQRARLAIEDVSLHTALTDLQSRAGVSLVYSPSRLPLDHPVSCECYSLTVGEALERLLAGTRMRYSVLDKHILIEPNDGPPHRSPADLQPATVFLASADLRLRAAVPPPTARLQQGMITGRVADATSGEPLSGAQVAVVGTSLGALTGQNGRYAITAVPEGQHRVQVSLIGYQRAVVGVAVSSGQSATADFSLQAQAVALEGIVAVGYGTQRRRDVTGSVASVSPARLEEMPNTSVAQALQGAAAGISIAAVSTGAEPSYNILIRGQNSITASNQPLVVVDGMPYNGNIADINQSDIASIDVLKDASSTAIYGARGANGVILLTTKKGQIGAPRFNYEGYVGAQRSANLPNLMNGEEFAEFKCKYMLPMPCDQALSPTERNMLESGDYTDWYGLVTRAGSQQQHTLSLSGGSEATRFYLSGSALDTEGVAIGDDFQRYTLRANLDHHVGSNVDAGFSTQLSQSDRSGRPASFSGAFDANPLMPAYDADGAVLITPWPEDPQRSNPLQDLNILDDNVSRRTLASGYVEARLPFVEGLSYRFNGGIDFLSHDRGSYWGRDTRRGINSQGRAETETRRAFDWTVENLLRYRRQFGVHSLDVTALYGGQAFRSEASELGAEGFPNDVLTYHQAHVARSLTPTHDFAESGLVSQMGRVNYGYDGRYLVTLTARRDGYSGFGNNYKYGTFPSVAVAWNVSDERFWNFDRFSSLKLRVSYGQNGNHAIEPYQTLARLAELSSYDGENSWPGFVPSTLGNPNLRWESTTSLNLGADFGILGDRLQGALDVYTSDTHDLLLDRLISPVHGIPRMVENVGSIRNRGIELALTGIPVETSRFAWTTDVNIAANRNSILDLYGDRTDDLANEWFIGQSINSHFGWVFDGVWQAGDDIASSHQPDAQPGDARVKDINGDGKIDVADRTFLGTNEPAYTAGLSNTLRYGAVSLTAFLHAVQGVTRYAWDLMGAPEDARGNALRFDWWTPDNPTSTRWENRRGANPYEVGLRDDASFVRVKDVMLAFDLPDGLVERFGAGSLRMYANGRNLWTFTDWPLLDPELSPRPGAPRPPPPGSPPGLTGSAPHQRTIPMERVFSIGINASF